LFRFRNSNSRTAKVMESAQATTQQKPFGIRVANQLFKSQGFAGHHLASYAHFVQTIIPEIITETPAFDYENDSYRFAHSFRNIYLHKPVISEHDGTGKEITPIEARQRDLTYSSPLFVQAEKRFIHKLTGEIIESRENFFCGCVPVMIRSIQCRLYDASLEKRIQAGECEYDEGGYFIVKGCEKVLIGMERMATDQVYVFPNKHDPQDLYAEISSLEEKSKKAPSQFYIHILPSNTLGKKSLRGYMNYFKKEFPLGILFKALGLTSGIKELIYKEFLFEGLKPIDKKALEELVDGIEEESHHIQSSSEAMMALAKIATTPISTADKKEIFITAVLEKEFLPRTGIDIQSFPAKIRFLAYMTQKLLQVAFGLRPHDDHDHERNKRSDESGILLASIFRQSWNKVNRELQFAIRKKLDAGAVLKEILLGQLVNNTSLTKDLTYSLSTGNWSAIRNSHMKTGVSQALNRFNHQSVLSHLRRNMNPMPKNSALSKPRQVHCSSWGFMCNFETPEGGSIGLIKNKALTCSVTIGFSDIFISEIIHPKLHPHLTEQYCWTILLNGKIQGFDSSDEIYHQIHKMKTKCMLSCFTGIYANRKYKEIYIWTDSGRKCRPLFIVRNKLNEVLSEVGIQRRVSAIISQYVDKTHLEIAMTEDWLRDLENGKKTWNDAVREGLIEWIDPAEQENLLICVRSEDLNNDGLLYTHAELNTAFIIGACSSVIPYANSDPAARITYQSSMSKQAASYPATNSKQRFDTMSHELWYPQKPICQTAAMEPMHFNELPGGQNCVVALITSGGANMEDAVILNQSSVDRGMFRETFLRTYKETESRITGQEEYFGKPLNEPAAHKLGSDGLVRVGVRVDEDDILIGKISHASDSDGKPIKPSQCYMKHGERGIVDQVLLTQNPDGSHTAKVVVRQDRIIEIGDKLAAVHSQKGVVGLIKQAVDMPFSSEGIIPDILINPHCVPTRMTIGHLKEIRAAKYGAASGTFPNATIFSATGKKNDEVQQEIAKGLKDLGYQEEAWETMYDGVTGNMMRAKIFVGVCFYQRLKHMVQDKIHARQTRGPIESFSHQPSAGRAREGGLRIGEMERDCMISLGGAFTIQQRLRDLSDKYRLPVCLHKNCGLIAIANPEKKIWICQACKRKRIGYVWVPYAAKLLIQQLMATNLALRIETDDIPEEELVEGKELVLKRQIPS
jgi:DNA-directed RNA polymerase II subunit RPB2